MRPGPSGRPAVLARVGEPERLPLSVRLGAPARTPAPVRPAPPVEPTVVDRLESSDRTPAPARLDLDAVARPDPDAGPGRSARADPSDRPNVPARPDPADRAAGVARADADRRLAESPLPDPDDRSPGRPRTGPSARRTVARPAPLGRPAEGRSAPPARPDARPRVPAVGRAARDPAVPREPPGLPVAELRRGAPERPPAGDRRLGCGIDVRDYGLDLPLRDAPRELVSKNANAPSRRRGHSRNPGGDLLSQGVYPQVPSARTVLTSVFGMGTGVTLSLWPPETVLSRMRQPASPTRDDDGSPPRTPEQARAIFNPSPRPISTGRLSTLPCVHLRPINVMVLSRALLR
jgi:hypothetical protein